VRIDVVQAYQGWGTDPVTITVFEGGDVAWSDEVLLNRGDGGPSGFESVEQFAFGRLPHP
jgi:hypothetical protein